MDEDQTLVVQSGKPVGLFRTHRLSPIAVIANGNVVGRWATMAGWQELIDAGPLGVRRHDGGRLAVHRLAGDPAGHLRDVHGRRAQALRRLARGPARADRRPRRHGRRAAARRRAGGRRHARRRGRSRARRAAPARGLPAAPQRRPRRARSRWCSARRSAARRSPSASSPTSPTCMDALLERGITPDIVTDQTTTDPIRGYVPRGMTAAECDELRASDRDELIRRADATLIDHIRAMLEFQRRGAEVFEYGNGLRARAQLLGVEDAFEMGVFTERYIRPLFCQGIGPFRWLAISGNPQDIYEVDDTHPRALRGRADHALDHRRARGRAVHGPAGAHRLAGLRRPPQARPARQRRDRERPHLGPDRVHARPPRLGLGGRAHARDRAHARRLRRHRRLADPERAAQHRLARRPRGRARLRRAWRSRPARRPSPTAPRRPPSGSARCSRTIRESASCATRTPATKPQSRRPRGPGWDSRDGNRTGRRSRPRRGRRGARQRLDAAGPLVLRPGRGRARAPADLRAQLDAALPRGQAGLARRPRGRQLGPRARGGHARRRGAARTASSTSAATARTRWR